MCPNHLIQSSIEYNSTSWYPSLDWYVINTSNHYHNIASTCILCHTLLNVLNMFSDKTQQSQSLERSSYPERLTVHMETVEKEAGSLKPILHNGKERLPWDLNNIKLTAQKSHTVYMLRGGRPFENQNQGNKIKTTTFWWTMLRHESHHYILHWRLS